MKKEIFQTIEIPEGIEIKIVGNMLRIKGEKGEIERKFALKNISLEKKGDSIIIGSKKATKSEKKIINTSFSHIKNMIKGVKEGFEYKLKICSSHFPISIEIKNKEAIIKNFLGEKISRKSKILDNVEVAINKDIITVFSYNKELAGQTSANFEKATRITGKDRRIFQDGIFITSKAGKEI
tara:strand:- start:731 stop:1273 length:543 start_codon:yes stop_codon:yes gene_type:complete